MMLLIKNSAFRGMRAWLGMGTLWSRARTLKVGPQITKRWGHPTGIAPYPPAFPRCVLGRKAKGFHPLAFLRPSPRNQKSADVSSLCSPPLSLRSLRELSFNKLAILLVLIRESGGVDPDSKPYTIHTLSESLCALPHTQLKHQ